MSAANDIVLDISELTTEFLVGGKWFGAVRGLSLSLRRNETLAIVGESGSGKSVAALSVLRLLPAAGARIGGGAVRFAGRDLVTLSEAEMAEIRGNAIAMIFQEPMTALNPTMTVGAQIAESVMIHRGLSRAEAMAEAVRLLEEVRIPSAASRLHEYPHQFSGGMRQRVMIAMALACHPEVLLADEPTTALDVTIQAQVLVLLNELRDAHGMAVLFITHNLGVVAQIADRVAVMHAGEIVELAPVAALFARPTHPYTAALLRAMPRVDRDSEELEPIAGQVPSIAAVPPGCAFAARCTFRQESCERERPALVAIDVAREHFVRCPVRAGAAA